jgi:hypothetical protein
MLTEAVRAHHSRHDPDARLLRLVIGAIGTQDRSANGPTTILASLGLLEKSALAR